jgi:hypothetical protein
MQVQFGGLNMSRERPSPGTLGNEAFKLLSKTAFYEDPTLPRSHANRHTKRIGGRRLTTVGLPYSEILESRSHGRMPTVVRLQDSRRRDVSARRSGTAAPQAAVTRALTNSNRQADSR